jgi:hypothetical protein
MDKPAVVKANNDGVDTTAERPKGKPKTKSTCFTIMPFGDWFDDYYQDLYCPAIHAAGLEPKRADDLYRPSTIINDIWSYTQSAKLILADLTGKNPNVFYELGLAHALAKPAILIAESIDDVPFDLRSLRILTYNKNQPDWGTGLRENITKSIKEIVDSPLESVLPTFLTVKASAKPKEITSKDKTLLEMKRDIDLLRMELRRGNLAENDMVSSAHEAENLIQHYLERGMRRDTIYTMLVKRGVPGEWINSRLANISDHRRRLNNVVARKRRRIKR